MPDKYIRTHTLVHRNHYNAFCFFFLSRYKLNQAVLHIIIKLPRILVLDLRKNLYFYAKSLPLIRDSAINVSRENQ